MFGECQRSLKDMCAEIDVMVFKGQTMSDWGRNYLRWDQKQYAAMDAAALRYLHEDQSRKGDLRNGDYSILLRDNMFDWLINRFNVQDYDLVKSKIRVLSRTRQFAVFGPEPFLQDLVLPQRVYNCQRNMLSLKNMCADIGIHINKGQTMSNWGRKHLRRDQLQYAAMDAVSEGIEIHKGQTMSNWGRKHLRRDQLQYAAMDVVALQYLHEDQIERNDIARGRFGYIDYDDWF
ncbi:unnamed protein product [Caenorhabditis brenneri]